MQTIEKWTRQSAMSNLAGHAATVAGLPSDIGALNGIVQGLLIHSDWLTAYGLDESRYRNVSRATLPVAERLDAILASDPQDVQTPRPPGGRAVGTCRDFALMLCSFLRSSSIASRVRCGFAGYFATPWEDHWVCEYWDQKARMWRLCDPQLDATIAAKCRIAFDPLDVPRDAFRTAGAAWLACRSGELDPDHFGHGDITGWWFLKINVMRDHYVVNGRETSNWDGWRTAPLSERVVGADEFARLDDLASRPEQPIVDTVPDWMHSG